MTILDMTLRQILQALPHHITWLLVALSMILNFEVTVRQVAVNRGYKNAVNICDRFAAVISFLLEVIETFFKKHPPSGSGSDRATTTPIKMAILCILLAVGATGCALIPPHAINLDIKGHNLETPYGKIEDGEIHVHTMWGSKSQSIVTPTPVNTDSGTTSTASIPVNVTVTPVVK